ncbi:MAG: Gfo/Idh/MocA family oxidoreductase [Acidipila sp.]|nr:Gfo/Idh/MocA family oxidoreductase [Acidipila sp.]
MTPLGVGIIGAGKIGAKRAQAIAGSAGARLVAITDSDAVRAAAMAHEFGVIATAGVDELIARRDVDAVVVATPHRWLAPVALAALHAKKHALVEKPLAIHAAAAEELVKAARSAGRVLKTGFNHRCHLAVAEARALANAGRIGRLMHIRCRYGHGGRKGYADEWRANPVESGGGELLDQGIHALDLFRWFLGEFTEVYAALTRAFWAMPVEDNAFCTLRTAAGQVAQLHASWTQWKNIFSFEVFGDRGYLLVEGLGGNYGQERLVVGHRPAEFGAPEEEIKLFGGADASWSAEWAEFESAIREQREPQGSGQDGWQALRLVEAAYTSEREGRVVKLGSATAEPETFQGEEHEQPYEQPHQRQHEQRAEQLIAERRVRREVSGRSAGDRRAARP